MKIGESEDRRRLIEKRGEDEGKLNIYSILIQLSNSSEIQLKFRNWLEMK